MILCPLPHDKPRQAESPRIICDAHVMRLRRTLESLQSTLIHLGDLYTAKPFGDHNDVRIARQDPPAPLNLAVVDLLDMRSDTPAVPHIAGWVQLIAEERHISWVPSAPHMQAKFLIAHLEWLVCHPAADEAFDELSRSWQWLRGVAGLGGAKPIFYCPVVHPDEQGKCAGPVFQRYERSMMVRCAKCGAEWDGELELRRAGLMLGSA